MQLTRFITTTLTNVAGDSLSHGAWRGNVRLMPVPSPDCGVALAGLRVTFARDLLQRRASVRIVAACRNGIACSDNAEPNERDPTVGRQAAIKRTFPLRALWDIEQP